METIYQSQMKPQNITNTVCKFFNFQIIFFKVTKLHKNILFLFLCNK